MNKISFATTEDFEKSKEICKLLNTHYTLGKVSRTLNITKNITEQEVNLILSGDNITIEDLNDYTIIVLFSTILELKHNINNSVPPRKEIINKLTTLLKIARGELQLTANNT